MDQHTPAPPSPDDRPQASPHILRAESPCGTTILTGPVDIAEGIDLVDRYLAPNRWTVRLLPIMPLDKAINVFTVGDRPQPVQAADLYVALRRAIITDPDGDGLDDYRNIALLAKIEERRPTQWWTGRDECFQGDCDHEEDRCPVTPVEKICRACSTVYDPGGEYGLDWIEFARVEWPCAPLRAIAAHYKISLSGDVSEAANHG